MATAKHRILVVGGGSAGIAVAARMLHKGYSDLAVIEPSSSHYYQPLWTLVGAGQAKAATTERAEASVIPKGATWIKNAASAVDPDNNTVTCTDGARYEYDVLVVCPGIQLDWNRTEGLEDTLGKDGVSSNYRFDLPVHTWDFVRSTRSGAAVFTMPSGPIKCAGAPQKIAHLACDFWRKKGVLNNIEVHLVVPTPRIFGIPAIADDIDSFLNNEPLRARYPGYAACPLVTSSHAMLLAEFDYSMQMTPSIPLFDPAKPHRAYWYLKKYGLPFMYWNLMLKGLA